MASVFAGREDEAGRLAERGTDGAENIGGGGSLILQGKRSRAAFRPASRDLVFLTDAGFVLEPEFEWLAAGRGDRRQNVRDFFFKSCDSRLVMRVGARPRREFSIAQARSSRLRICLVTEMRYSSNTHCARSISLQRTTPWTAGVGPASTIATSARLCSSLSFEGCPVDLPSTRPSGPLKLNRRTQSRMVCSPTPPSRAASAREPPS